MYKHKHALRNLYLSLSTSTEDSIQNLREPHPFIANFLGHIGWDKNTFIDFIRRKHIDVLNDLFNRPLDTSLEPQSPFPKYCHKIWLTSQDDPRYPPEDYLPPYFSMCRSHPPDWTHYFWTNSAAVAHHIEEQALKVGAKILVQNINFLSLGPVDSTLQALISHRKFVLAADVLKFAILDRFGGIYSDLGICFDEAILAIASSSDYTFVLAGNVFFQTSWISLHAGSLLSTLFLAILNNPEVFSSEYALDASQKVSSGSEVHTFAGLGYTACALLFMPKSATAFIFPPHSSHFTWRSQQSWFGDTPKHGNVLISDTDPTIVTQDNYLAFSETLRETTTVIGNDRYVNEKLGIISKLFKHFTGHPPLLCRQLTYNTSDKLDNWHNYGYIYHYLLSSFPHRRCKLLEIGDSRGLWGRTKIENGVISLGGSMGAWGTFLNNPLLHGVEIERKNHKLSLSESVFVNESYYSSLEKLLAEHRYDIVIDNGIHTFENAVLILGAAFPRLSAGGYYIIEAVPAKDIPTWRGFFDAADYTGAILNLPNPENVFDNCIIILARN
jgi:hypothetical protein